MKTKCLLLFTVFAGLFCQHAQGQITLTAADLPAFGLTIENAQDTLLAEVALGTASNQGQNWDFTNLDTNVITTNTVVVPSETPAGNLFPTATFAFETNDSLYNYAELRNDVLLALGGSGPLIDSTIIAITFAPLSSC